MQALRESGISTAEAGRALVDNMGRVPPDDVPDTPEWNEAVRRMAERTARDIDRLTLESFGETPGATSMYHVEPSQNLDQLIARQDVTEGAMCYVEAENSMYIYTGRGWTQINIR